ncbi:T9SS type A sorting domain-containing protein [Reichenbachiella sp. MSK19-1]|uniref:T9SS type A sorting domain-containing protein n=1 Tax=Reichenbachiella sp. MSK19-1 TaxID=1897631 RepID=UPI000E6B97C5|nr:T9SS type A sorting domain-containing protein [Reichenbachiella sp. MSK19-1]
MNKTSTITIISIVAFIALIGIWQTVKLAPVTTIVVSSDQSDSKTGHEKWQEEHEAKVAKHKKEGYKKSDKPSQYILLKNALMTREGQTTTGYGSNYQQVELTKAKVQSSLTLSKARTKAVAGYDFDERGPGNVPGRTRAVVIDPDDADVWIAGAVGGGIWKTIDGGQSWTNKSTGLTNLAISCMVMAPSNHDVLYAGTGEGWGASGGMIKGSGIYKSTDRGETWEQIAATAANDNFQMVNRLIVDPQDENVLLVANSNDPLYAKFFNSGVLKSTDGGANWTKVLSTEGYAQQIVADPSDFNTQYVSVRGVGVYKSLDAGDTWVSSSKGLLPNGRLEIAVSPVDPNRLFASVVGDVSGTGADLYLSDDAGANWSILTEKDGEDLEFLGGQGWYDNTVLAHPFDKDKVYVGGVNLFLFTIQDGQIEGEPQFIGANENGTDAFMGLVNFDSGQVYGNKIALGSIDASEFVSIEIRFGAGLSQKAHRFEVPEGATSGVGAGDYSYQDYVDVPFEVWDTDNDQQLMVSFRDQQGDGKFNLLAQNSEGDASVQSREYLYVHKVNYDGAAANSSIAVNGGHEFQDMYFFWPFLVEGATWDDTNLPTSTFELYYGQLVKRYKKRDVITDAYGENGGKNSFSQTQGATATEGVHPDNHSLTAVISDATAQEFQIILTGDGGLYKTAVGTNPGFEEGDWTFSGLGFNTTQFYAVDKMGGESRYVAGAQDNGSWMSQENDEGSPTSLYARANGGDGFGVAWNYKNADLLLTSVYYNAIEKSSDGGATFSNATTGLSDSDETNAPFNTKIENVKSDPDLVYAVGASGVWKSTNFGGRWSLSAISEQWALRTFMDVKISRANNNIVWAGGAMTDSESLHVSIDRGETFAATSNYDEVTLGQISGLATHPTEDSTAYVIYSFAKGPKILKTEDLGQTWVDLSGFGTGAVSTNGFPDVAVYDLLVMPHVTTTIWAGTEIGIFESTDAGASWHMLDGDIPAVSVWELRNIDDQVVVGTHGRGIWSVTIDELPTQGFNPVITYVGFSLDGSPSVNYNLEMDVDSVKVTIGGELVYTDKAAKTLGSYEYVSDEPLATGSEIAVIAYSGGQKYVSQYSTPEVLSYGEPVDSYSNDFETTSSDFSGVGFTIVNFGLGSRSIVTLDGYEDNANYVYTLSSPIIVSSDPELNKVEFDQVVIVEPANDYAVVEASLDGKTWVEISERFDASMDEAWNSLFGTTSFPTVDNYRAQSIVLTDHFQAGDEVLIRFRLNSNASVNGWGWAIDNLVIQAEEVLGTSSNTVSSSILVYPNPVTDRMINLQWEEPIRSALTIELRNTSGQLVVREEVSSSDLESGQLRLDLTHTTIKKGMYLMNFKTDKGETLQVQKVLIN